MRVQHVIIGAGLSGIVLAQQLAEKGEEILIIEKKNHMGGNCYDYYDENGILIHKYGPHIFHTDNEEVRKYVNQFSEFTNFHLRVLGFIDNKLVPIPFNFNSIYILYPPQFAQELEHTLLQFYPYNAKVSIGELQDKAQSEGNTYLSFLATYIFEKVFKNYTMKQRGVGAEDINPEVIKRVPIVISRDDRYFPYHPYQGMPMQGYTKMFEKMLNSPNIHIVLQTDYKKLIADLQYDQLYITSSIDEYFDYKYGTLEYRKTLFHFETYDQQAFQENIVINYPNDYEYTRITEMKKFYPQSSTYNIKKTVICKEFPGKGEVDAYPVESLENLQLLEKYKADAQSLKNIHFLGRLANYKYRDMDKTIKNVLDYLRI